MEKDKDSVDDLAGDLPGVAIDESTPYLFEIAWEVANRGEFFLQRMCSPSSYGDYEQLAVYTPC